MPNESVEKISIEQFEKSYQKTVDNNATSADDLRKVNTPDDILFELSSLPSPPVGKDNINHSISLILMLNDEENTSIDLSQYIEEIIIIKNFLELHKPIYRLMMSLDLILIKAIEKSRNYKYRLKIDSVDYRIVQMDLSMAELPNSNKKENSLDVFIIPFSVPDKITTSDLNDRINNNDPKTKLMKSPYDVDCFDMRHVKTSHAIISTNYRNQQLINVIMDIINREKQTCFPEINNLVLTEPDTKEYIENISITPMTIFDSLKTIQDKHNIFNKKMILYVNDDTLYITKRGFIAEYDGVNDKINVLVCGRNEYNDEFLEKVKPLLNDENEIVYMCENEPKISDKTADTLNKFGDKMIFKSDTSTSGLTSQCIGIKSETDAMKSIKYSESNPLLHDDYEGKMTYNVTDSQGSKLLDLKIDEAQENAFKMNLLLKNVNMKNFKPTTIVNVLFADPDKKIFDGYYYIKDITFIYSQEVDDWELNCQLNIGRIYKEDGSLYK